LAWKNGAVNGLLSLQEGDGEYKRVRAGWPIVAPHIATNEPLRNPKNHLPHQTALPRKLVSVKSFFLRSSVLNIP
jgi:hypothetical protein